MLNFIQLLENLDTYMFVQGISKFEHFFFTMARGSSNTSTTQLCDKIQWNQIFDVFLLYVLSDA